MDKETKVALLLVGGLFGGVALFFLGRFIWKKTQHVEVVINGVKTTIPKKDIVPAPKTTLGTSGIGSPAPVSTANARGTQYFCDGGYLYVKGGNGSPVGNCAGTA